ncbi:MAG: glucosamine-6-phosphate deaminase, partial [Ferruginibacter sp.]|nr:glucosamine-6-phosphate deaminase [Ferruginibacter sp.]
MELQIAADYQAMSEMAAEMIIQTVQANPGAVISLAGGDTPRLTYAIIVKRAKEENIDFSKISFIGLDEWVGVAPENTGSCHYFLQQNILQPLNLQPGQVHLFDALADDLPGEVEKINRKVAELGGSDLMLVGLGMNGHIGFNEPGASFDGYAHITKLDEFTQSVGQKYFASSTELKLGVTLGLKHLLEARKAILIANGTKKAAIVKQVLEGEI